MNGIDDVTQPSRRRQDARPLTRRESARRWAAVSVGAGWLGVAAAGVAWVVPYWPRLILVAAAVLIVLALAAGLAAWNGYRASEQARARRQRLRAALQDEPGAVLACRGERIVAANDAARALLPPGPVEGNLLASILPGWTIDRIPHAGDAEALAHAAGQAAHLRLARRTLRLGERRYVLVSIRGRDDRTTASVWEALSARFAAPAHGPFGLLLLELRRAGAPVDDDVMQRTGRRLGPGPAGVRLVARWGRDRYALVVDADPARLHALGVSLAEVLTEWLRTDGGAPGVDARAGAAAAPLDGASPGALMDAAEHALAKGEPGGEPGGEAEGEAVRRAG